MNETPYLRLDPAGEHMELHEIIRKERAKRFSMDEVTATFKEWGIDCSQSTLSRIERGAIPSWPIIDGYCKLFGWSLAELERRLERAPTQSSETSDQSTLPRKKTVPLYVGRELSVLSWVQAGNWSDSPCLEKHEQETKFVTGKSPKNAFLLKVNGTSMENCEGRDHFPNGSYIVVNPDMDKAIDDYLGKFVVAVDEATQETTFKQLIQDGGSKFLKPLNSQYPVMKVTANTRLIGVVSRVIDDRKV